MFYNYISVLSFVIIRNEKSILRYSIVQNISVNASRDSRCAYYIPYSAGNFKNFVCFQLMSIFVYMIWVVNTNTSTFIDIWFVSQFFFILIHTYSFHAYILSSEVYYSCHLTKYIMCLFEEKII